MRVQRAAIGPDPKLARGARRAPRPQPVPEITVQLPSRLTVFLSPRSIQQVQFRARPTAALKARPVVVAKAHFGVFAAAVRTPLDRSSFARASPDPVRSRKHPKETVRARPRVAKIAEEKSSEGAQPGSRNEN